MKHAFILNHEHGTNIAFMSSASMHQLDAQYGKGSTTSMRRISMAH